MLDSFKEHTEKYKEEIINSLLQKGIFKVNNKHLYNLSINELEQISQEGEQ